MAIRHDKNGGMRLEILKSAAAAFRRRGYYGASVDEIAGAASRRQPGFVQSETP